MFIRETASSVSLGEISEEEFNSTDTNFNLPALGKLYVIYPKIEKYRRKLKEKNDVKAENDKASR